MRRHSVHTNLVVVLRDARVSKKKKKVVPEKSAHHVLSYVNTVRRFGINVSTTGYYSSSYVLRETLRTVLGINSTCSSVVMYV